MASPVGLLGQRVVCRDPVVALLSRHRRAHPFDPRCRSLGRTLLSVENFQHILCRSGPFPSCFDSRSSSAQRLRNEEEGRGHPLRAPEIPYHNGETTRFDCSGCISVWSGSRRSRRAPATVLAGRRDRPRKTPAPGSAYHTMTAPQHRDPVAIRAEGYREAARRPDCSSDSSGTRPQSPHLPCHSPDHDGRQY